MQPGRYMSGLSSTQVHRPQCNATESAYTAHTETQRNITCSRRPAAPTRREVTEPSGHLRFSQASHLVQSIPPTPSLSIPTDTSSIYILSLPRTSIAYAPPLSTYTSFSIFYLVLSTQHCGIERTSARRIPLDALQDIYPACTHHPHRLEFRTSPPVPFATHFPNSSALHQHPNPYHRIIRPTSHHRIRTPAEPQHQTFHLPTPHLHPSHLRVHVCVLPRPCRSSTSPTSASASTPTSSSSARAHCRSTLAKATIVESQRFPASWRPEFRRVQQCCRA